MKGCDYVIALTHMRTPNDIKLAENCDDIDIILGGHDHVFEIQLINGKYVIKSGTDFRQFSKITINFDKSLTNNCSPEVTVEEIAVTSQILEDPKLKEKLEKYTSKSHGLIFFRKTVYFPAMLNLFTITMFMLNGLRLNVLYF